MEFIISHPVLSVSLIGSAVGTLLSYLVPDFTRNCLCADESFCIGSLGFAVFIHNGFAHFFGNLFFIIPGSILCEKFYDPTLILAIILIYSFAESMLCIPTKRASCGYSGVAYMLCSMACMKGLHWWGFLIFGILFCSSFFCDHGERTDVFSHVLGFITGAVVGVLLQR